MSGVKGRWERYKRSTDTFIRWLSRASGIEQLWKQPVQQLLAAAQTVTSEMPGHVAMDLAIAIHTRKEVTEIYRNNDQADSGHKYYVSVLEQCQRLLAPLVPETHASSQEQAVNRFASLEVVESAEDPSSPVTGSLGECPADIVLPDPPDDVSIVDLLGQTNAFAAACLLADVEDVMNHIGRAWDNYKRDLTATSLLSATAITNLCLLEAESITVAMELTNSSFETLEHVVTAAHLSEAIAEIQVAILNRLALTKRVNDRLNLSLGTTRLLQLCPT